ncbi:glycosyl hydrolase family 61-domain-containing protein [Parachaetomium inaequale]|uniref:lytic cellulose monooxygenase (C4-dehydrogenating) n=1 Tax=Parachaetomium inaequale TaxID=2588326 RepID=A0AAN6P7C5_9PEZI|nr:glycosyl hydrolase family 61-domain-containing protein [Parachaetomium inaequale]
MKFSAVAALALEPCYASAHYFFNMLLIDGKETRPDQYVRANTRQAKYNPTKWVNVRDGMTPDVADFRCNKGAFSSAPRTQTAEVRAGARLGFKLAVDATMQHPGPALAYEGDGDWFKMHEESRCWCTWDKDVVEFTVPKDIPDGEYLVRVEHIGVHGAHVGQAEFYNSCAQVKITGGGHGTPGPTVKFPGAYKQTDPSFNFSIYGGFKPYPMPGPAVWTVWTGGGSGQSSNSTGSASEQPTQQPTRQPVPVQPTSTPISNAGSGGPKGCARRHARSFK